MTGYCTKCDYSTLEHNTLDGIIEEVIRAAGEYSTTEKGFELKCPIDGQVLKIK